MRRPRVCLVIAPPDPSRRKPRLDELVGRQGVVAHEHAHCLFVTAAALAGDAPSPDSKQPAGWPDSAPLVKRNLVFELEQGGCVRVDVLGERLFRVRHSKTRQWTESALNRYSVLNAAFADVAFEQSETGGVHVVATKLARLSVSGKDGAVALADGEGKPLTQQTAPVYEAGGGYDIRFTLARRPSPPCRSPARFR